MSRKQWDMGTDELPLRPAQAALLEVLEGIVSRAETLAARMEIEFSLPRIVAEMRQTAGIEL
jgi:hypothetical protein